MSEITPSLWQHQFLALKKMEGQSHFALFMEMGTGKTRTMIHKLQALFDEGHLPILIFAPPVVLSQWKEEFKKYSYINQNQIRILNGNKKNRLNETVRGQIWITNYESLLMAELFDKFKRARVIVADEVHKIKNHSAKRSQLLHELGDQADYRFGLSGTPILNSPMDLFSQWRFLDRGEKFGRNFFQFRNRFFYDKNGGMPKHIHFPNWQPKNGALDEMSKLSGENSISVKKEECLDLPDLVEKIIHVELSEEQKKHYEAMERDFITFIEDEACVASLAITKALRLQQILTGFLPTASKEVNSVLDRGYSSKNLASQNCIAKFKDNPRLEALQECLEEIAPYHKVIVWCTFKENYRQVAAVCEKLKLGYVEVHGEISQKEKDEAVNSFQTRPDIRVYIGHPGSGGIGVNLTVASYAIYYSRNFSLEQYLQSQARNHRGGSEIHEKITHIHLVAPNTLDELILERLRQKQKMGDEMIFEIAKKLKSKHDLPT